MRKITSDAYRAFMSGYPFKKSNTEVKQPELGAELYLFGNLIAKEENDLLYICDGGYIASTTTRERLNMFPNVHVRKVKDKLILNEKYIIDSNWICVSDLE